MAVQRVLMFVAFAALVCGAELEENEQKKRGAGKTTTLNAIPTGAQKPDYTYSIYGQNQQSSPPSPSYQTVQSSFYPSQGPSQYYTSQPPESNQYQQQPQLSLIPPPSSSPFVPLNFVPNPGYQAKYQLIPSKTQNGNIQLTLVPQTQSIAPNILPFPFFSPNPGAQLNQQQALPSQYLSQNYQLPFGSPYVGQPSMFLFAQPNPNLYQNLLYPNPVQNIYYPSSAQQARYPSLPPPSSEYEKVQGPVSQSITKDDNDLTVHSSEYVTSSIQPQDSYQKAYNSRNSYSKLS